MFKSIFKAVAVSAVAVFFCVGCGDKSDDGPDDGGSPVDGGGAKSYTITFNAAGGTVSPTSAKTGDDGKLTSLPEPTLDGCTFDGWYTDIIGGTAVTVNNVYSANTTIYAQWTSNTYRIWFDVRGGTMDAIATSAWTGTDGKLASLPTPTRIGYIFEGWYTDRTDGTQVTTSTTFSVDATITIYAHWKIENDDGYTGSYGSVEYRGKTYKTVQIGTQTWFAENLDYDVTGSKCYNNRADSCAKYGRLYNWSAAMTACPSGWHLPSNDEWNTLMDYVGGRLTAGSKLKSTSNWYDDGNGIDEYGFSALPGGAYRRGGNFADDSFASGGSGGYWWSADEITAASAWLMTIGYNKENASLGTDDNANLNSVRCVED
jgi:uncharacterized protein (TIGR02145 family)/uncharacterized repeat protein (TIGR02543 family)